MKVQKTIHIDRGVAQAVRVAAAIADCSFSEMIERLSSEALAAREQKADYPNTDRAQVAALGGHDE